MKNVLTTYYDKYTFIQHKMFCFYFEILFTFDIHLKPRVYKTLINNDLIN